MKHPIDSGLDAWQAIIARVNDRVGRRERSSDERMEAAEQGVIQIYIREAKQDDSPSVARYLAGRMADHLEGKRTLSPEGLRYFAEALRQIAEGEDPAKALHTRLGKGKRPRDIDDRNPRIRDPMLAMEVQMLVDRGIQQTRNRASISASACAIVAEKHGMDETYIENIFRKYRAETR